MYTKSYGVESDGELFKMQQEAIRRAREMSKAATLPLPPHAQEAAPEREPAPALPPAPAPESQPLSEEKALDSLKKHSLFGGLFGGHGKGVLGGILSNLKMDDILLLVLLFLLLTEHADTDIILIVGFLLIAGFLGD